MELLPNSLTFCSDSWQEHPSLADESQRENLKQGMVLNTPTIVPYCEELIPYLQSLSAWEPQLGVSLKNHESIDVLVPYLKYIALIGLDFPKFSDGRAYTQAKELRTNFGFAGRLRATGDILPPQISFMCRCGFDSLIVDTNRFEESVWIEALAHYRHVYQIDAPASDSTENSTANSTASGMPASILQKRSLYS